MTILIFGRNGQVGSALHTQLEATTFETLMLGRDEVDFSRPDSVYNAVIALKPSLVVNAVAYTNVDKAQDEPELAELVNAKSVCRLAEACSGIGAPLIHFSTDYVFDGTSVDPIGEDATVNSLNVYGKTKLAGENAIRDRMNEFMILRVSGVFSARGRNFVNTMLALAKERAVLEVVHDQLLRPTYAGHIAQTVIELVDGWREGRKDVWGTFHLADGPACSWYEFAQEFFSSALRSGVITSQPQIRPITSSEYRGKVARPLYSVLDCSRLEFLLGRPMSNWGAGLERVFEAIKKTPSD